LVLSAGGERKESRFDGGFAVALALLSPRLDEVLSLIPQIELALKGAGIWRAFWGKAELIS